MLNQGRPPVEVLRKRAGRDSIWRYVRVAEAEFTIQDVMKATSADYKCVAAYLDRLVSAGVVGVERVPVNKRATEKNRYTLLTDPGPQTPVISADGKLRNVRIGGGRSAIWTAMRILKRFGVVDVLVSVAGSSAPATKGTVEDYARILRRAGYLRVTRRGNNPGVTNIYQMIRDTGPRAPIVKSDRSVYDANEERLIWSPTEEADHE